MSLLNISNNSKTIKGDKQGEYLTAILYLSPYTLNKYNVNVCPFATKGCSTACLNTAGRGKFSIIQKARRRKTEYFIENKEKFLKQLRRELTNFIKRCDKLKVKPAVRLNGTSDIDWVSLGIINEFPAIQFYDYTKSADRCLKYKDIPNYHLTYSRTETDTNDKLKELLDNDINIAVVFYDNIKVISKLPKEYLGYPVFNGDITDLRFTDPPKHVIGLSAKGKAKKDTSGFVIKLDVQHV